MVPGRNEPCPCGSGRKYKSCCRGRTGAAAISAETAEGRQLLALLNSGRVVELEGRVSERLKHSPDSGFLLGLMGVVLQMQGRDGLALLERAANLLPNDADAQLNLATAIAGKGLLVEAADRLQLALGLRPNSIRARMLLGQVACELGDLGRAEGSFRQVLQQDPACIDACLGLAEVLAKSGRMEEAQAYCNDMLVRLPSHPGAVFCQGNVARMAGRLDMAAAAFARVIELAPEYLPAYNNLGCALIDLGQHVAAEAALSRALHIAPGYVDALHNLGRLYSQQFRYAEAEAVYRRVIEKSPGNVDSLLRLVEVLREQGQEAEARAICQHLIQHDPTRWDARLEEVLLRIPVVPLSVETARGAEASFLHGLRDILGWLSHDGVSKSGAAADMLGRLPFLLAYRNGNHLTSLSVFGDVAQALVGTAEQEWSGASPDRCRCRLLVVSHHLRRHSVWDVVLRGLLENIDRSKFEVIVYHLGTEEDSQTAIAKELADVWRDRSTVSDGKDWRTKIEADQPDVIFYPEIGMDSVSFHLASLRLAPLQVASWGHPVTTGLPTVDLYFSGELIEPDDADAHYRERLVLLPGTGCCTVPLSITAEPIPDIEAVLKERGSIRFVLPHRPIKFDPADDALYAQIAGKVPDCVFIVFSDPIYPWASEQVFRRLGRAFSESGLDPDRYLLMLPWLSSGAFLSLLDLADIYLDCPSFSGYTTAWQAVHRGTPIVTLEGRYMRQRLASGLLRKIGLPETVALSADAFVSIAADFAAVCRDPVRREQVRARIFNAAKHADRDLDVVRVFESSVLDALEEVRRVGAH